MLIPMSSVIAVAGDVEAVERPSYLIVSPALEMPNSARPPSAVAVFIEMTKLTRE